MAEDLTVSGAHPLGARSTEVPARLEESVPVDSFPGTVEVRWAPEVAVTPLGQLPFFVDFLKQADLFDPFVREAPLQYTIPNAPQVRDVLGTLLLSVVSGASRYAHVNALRWDGVNPGLLGMRRVCSDDSVRRAIGRNAPHCRVSGGRQGIPTTPIDVHRPAAAQAIDARVLLESRRLDPLLFLPSVGSLVAPAASAPGFAPGAPRRRPSGSVCSGTPCKPISAARGGLPPDAASRNPRRPTRTNRPRG